MGRLKNKVVTQPYQVLRVCRVSKSLGLRGKVGRLSFLGKEREWELGAVDEKLPCLRKSSVERTGAPFNTSLGIRSHLQRTSIRTY